MNPLLRTAMMLILLVAIVGCSDDVTGPADETAVTDVSTLDKASAGDLSSTGGREAGKRVGEIRFPVDTKLGAIALSSGELRIPSADTVINENDRAVFFAREGAIHKLEKEILSNSRASVPWLAR